MGVAAKSHQLTVFLLKDGLSCPDEVLDGVDSLIHHPVAVSGTAIGDLYIRPQKDTPPRWTRLFDGFIDLHNLRSMSTAGALLIPADNRYFAVTFGYGRHLLRPGTWEERFGLRATLNCLRPNSIRIIDRRSFDAISRHTREQASREASATEFGLDVEQDMLRAVTGVPADESLGTRIAGADALAVTVAVDLHGLPALLSRFRVRSEDTAYRSFYPWVDHVGEVSDAALIATLEAKLLDAINGGKRDHLWLVVPEVLEWDAVSGFRYTRSKKEELASDIHIASFLKCLPNGAEVDTSTLKHRRVYCFTADDEFASHQWRIYECIYFEIDHGSNRFLLTGGKWYRIAPSFLEEVNEAVRAIPVCQINLPSYTDADEGDYNKRVVAVDPDRFHLMDAKNLSYGGGHSKVEFCDIISREKQLLYVKRYGSAGAFSHLFSQGTVSAELLHMDREFRARVNDLLPDGYKCSMTDFKPSDYEVVFAVISQSKADWELPFFSRVNLRAAARRLRGFGYKVSFAKIGPS